ncbi:type II secretion system secretin GspD [Thioalkalivibrio thiocyanodenitrificans]|uniref:type II secretion system secretin GspD n=1 Tax=Thioalkalivibrio thiocyanodenitrificans TaxID=243063 RepID=UPI001E4D7FB7|nr:type II secretion system secretin GspD [Thioalkalivibrio thiocyanodenitrificans]
MNAPPAGRVPSRTRVPPFSGMLRTALVLTLAFALGACAALDRPRDESLWIEIGTPEDEPAPIPTAPADERLVDADARDTDAKSVEIYPGTGVFFDAERAARAVQVDRRTGDITLNFEGADLQEVVHFILGKLLEENYVVDPGVSGNVTMQTSSPLPREDLLPTLESLLRLNGATLVTGDDGLYQVRPREGALRGTSVPRTGPGGPGLNVRIVPLEYIGVAEMLTILEPFLTPDAVVRVDPARNLLILAGSRRELSRWQETIDIFDVDWLAGMSVALYTLNHADVGEVVSELERVIAMDSGTPLAGLFHMIPIERLNAVLVVTPQPRYLEEAEVWVKRLDRRQDVHRARLHVYRMQHGRAEEVAGLLTDIYGGETRTQAARPERGLAPGVEAVEIGSDNPGGDSPAPRTGGGGTVTATMGGGDNTQEGALEGEVRIIADDSNNALLIMASERDYDLILQGLSQLDVPSLQVLVDATIIEVSLTDELRYGLQWFFTDSLGDYSGRGILADSANISRTFPGFNYSIVDSADQVRAVLSALAQDSRVNVLSSPSVMVMDNQEALIRVGDQVPVRASEATSVVTDSPVTVTNIQYRDTGVSLRVTPRVNAGGMVQMEIEQEVNDVSSTTSSNIDSPTIQQRLIRSSVAVQSGDTIVLGGLIRETDSRDESGVPGLRRLPMVGPLFGATSTSLRRTELLVLIKPRVAQDAGEARMITEAVRRRMKGLESRIRDAQRQPAAECSENATSPC